jgi:DNA mismatch endonuclease (patch repair protein)
MTDTISKEQRSANMRAVRDRNTQPEICVRRIAYGLGYRFRLHRRDLPGTPDLVFPARRKVIFVHGCFWHGHGCKRSLKMPQTNKEFWEAKITGNVERDGRQLARLRKAGWRALIVWECETKATDTLSSRLQRFLE